MNDEDIKVIKLTSGEEIVARCHGHSETELLVLEEPYIIQLNDNGIALFPWLLSAQTSEEIHVTPLSIISIANPKEKIITGYKKLCAEPDADQYTMEFEDEEYDFDSFSIH